MLAIFQVSVALLLMPVIGLASINNDVIRDFKSYGNAAAFELAADGFRQLNVPVTVLVDGHFCFYFHALGAGIPLSMPSTLRSSSTAGQWT